MIELEGITGDGTSVAQLLEAGVAAAKISEKEELLYAIVPDGYELKMKDISAHIEDREDAPRRQTGNTALRTSESFCEFVERGFVDGTTVCFASINNSYFSAIFNYQGSKGAPGWEDRTATLQLQHTTEWKRWIKADRTKFSQLELADFFDANIENIVEPDAASIVEMITALKVKRKAEFHSAVDQNTGFTNVQYTENTSGEAVKGSLDFFGKFTIGVSPFRGSDPYKVKCSLRFNIDNDNNLRVFFALINADLVEEAAFDVERDKVLSVMSEIDVPVFDV